MGEREKVGLIFNDLVKIGVVKVLIVIGRDYLDCGLVVFLNCEMEGMMDGSDVVFDWFLFNLMFNIVGGVIWVFFYYGGGVGMGFLQYVGMVILVDGIEEVVERLRRCLYNDLVMGIF